MKIGFIQFAPKFGDQKYNLKKIKELVSSVKADLLVLPEMSTTGYMVKSKLELKRLAERISDGSTIKMLTSVAKKNNCCLIVGIPELKGRKIFNSSVAITNKGVIAKHQKTHLFLKEKLFFNPGTTKPQIFKWKGIRIGLGVCYDYMFPEFWRELAIKKADVFCNTANFVFNFGFKVMQTRSVENGVFSVTVNRVGKERGQRFYGGSEIVDNKGNVLKKAGEKEEVFVINLDLIKSRSKKWNKYNDLIKDRRPEMYK